MARYSFASLKPEYSRLWNSMRVKPESYSGKFGAKYWANYAIQNRSIYERVQARTGVPWFVVACMHYREASGRFNTWLHNGDPMRDKAGRGIRTVRVPANRPPNPNVDWVEGAYDALVVIKGFDKIRDWSPERVAYILESFNGWGYRNPNINIPSPYLWGGTTVQKRGKYIRDHVYDAGTWDTQLGGMAVLRAIMDICPDAKFTKPALAPVAPPVPMDNTPPASPKATETGSAGVRPAAKSRTIWGGITTYLGGVGSAFFGLFSYVNNPYALTAFAVIILLMTVGVILVVRGYIDVRKVVTHLTDEVEADEGGAAS